MGEGVCLYVRLAHNKNDAETYEKARLLCNREGHP